MEVFDVLNEISARGNLRNAIVGGYVVKELRQPPIFTTEELDTDGKFVDFKIIYVSDGRTKRTLSTGNVVAFVPKDTKIKDFYEFKGTLSLGGFDYTRVVTMMVFRKKEIEGATKPIWVVQPVSVNDLEVSLLTRDLYEVVMDFAEAPLSYRNKDAEYILKPKSEESDSSKVYFDFKGVEKSIKLRPKPTKETKEFEDSNSYLIDSEFEIIKEALRFPVLAVNLNDFGHDRMLLRYMEWLVDEDIVVVESMSDVLDDDRQYLIVSDRDLDDIPYLELKRGVLTGWDL